MIQVPSQEFWDEFLKTNGAFSCAEAVALGIITNQVPPNGLWAEFGVYHGKSAMSAIHGGTAQEFHLIEPEFEKTIHVGEVAERVAKASKDKCRIAFIIGSSIDYLSGTDYKFSYVFVDSGNHQDLPMLEVKALEDRMVQGGIVAFHDLFAQFLQVNDAYNYLLGTGKYEEIVLPKDEIIHYCEAHELEKKNTSWHHRELDNPFFIGALRRK